MKHILSLLLAVTACGGSGSDGGITNPPPKKPDPWITVRVRDQLDTTTAAGRADWRFYALLTGPSANINGSSFQYSVSIGDRRAGHSTYCAWSAADSVGQRLYEGVAFADTTTEASPIAAAVDSMAAHWMRGDHVLPTGWAVLTSTPTDAWVSAQYNDGHGLVATDPIKWGFDWTSPLASSFYERTDGDSYCSVAA